MSGTKYVYLYLKLAFDNLSDQILTKLSEK
jgi:hypothetical protein